MPAVAPSVTPQELEAALFKAENKLESHRKILEMLFNSRVFVVLDTPWDGRSLPSTETHVLLVSDGENQAQAMLALFTSADKIEAIPRGDTLFHYPVEVDARWALLGVPKDAGIAINPSSIPGFRILPALAAELRKLAEQHLAAQLPKPGTAAETGSSQ
ncbi:MAG: SseB family protein [Gammaproteobacteria bacterium]